MTVTDVTANWLSVLEQLDRRGPTLAPDQPAAAPEPAWPTASQWQSVHPNFGRLRQAVDELRASGTTRLPHDMLWPGSDPQPSYNRRIGDAVLDGHIYQLDGDGPPFTSHLRRFVVFVPAEYHRTGDQGHYVLVHYPPFLQQTAHNAPHFAAAHDGYPDGFWTQRFVVDYLIWHHLLTSFARSTLATLLVLPVYRFTVGNAQAPITGVARLTSVLTPLLAKLEALEPRLAGRAGGSRIGGIAVSAFSAGAQAASHAVALTQRPADLALVRGLAFIDGVPPDGRALLQSLVGTSATRGWLDTAPPPGVRRHAAMFQQANSGSGDLVGPAQALPAVTVTRGRTAYIAGRSAPAFNEFAFHWVDTTAMGRVLGLGPAAGDSSYHYWHGNVSRYFLEAGLSFVRHSFLR